MGPIADPALVVEDMSHADVLNEAIRWLEKSNADLQPELVTAQHARELLKLYALAEKLVAFGVAALARKIDDSSEVARATGSSIGKAKAVVLTGKAAAASEDLASAMQHGEISLDQAAEIAQAEDSAPGSARELVSVAQRESFQVLKDRARKTKLEAEQHRGLAQRQHAARRATHSSDDLGMVHIHLALEPHVGVPITARAEAEAQRLARAERSKAKSNANATAGCAVELEPFERHLADAYTRLLDGSGKGRAKRPELVVLVSHTVAQRGWKDVRKGEVCKIPGVGPVAPQVAREIADDAFLSALFYDGEDLRQFKRWSRNIPVEVATALELGRPPDFDGVRCVDCGNHFRTEFDHVKPIHAGGLTSEPNLRPRCYPCHAAKTKRDLEATRATQKAKPRPRSEVQPNQMRPEGKRSRKPRSP